jgi:rod shape-determining protein MreD
MGSIILPVLGLTERLRATYPPPFSCRPSPNVARETGRSGHGRSACRSYTGSQPHHAPTSRRPAITYLSPLLAVVTGIVHAGLAPAIVVAGVRPNFVLVAVVLVTTLFGFLPGATWAFVAGLTVNLLVGEPLGSVPLALLAVATLVAGGQRLFGRLVWIYPVLAAFVGSVVADVIGLVLLQLLAEPGQAGFPMQLIVPAAVLNAALVAVLVFPVRALTERYAPEERPAW